MWRVAANLGCLTGPIVGGLLADDAIVLSSVLDVVASSIAAAIGFHAIPETLPGKTRASSSFQQHLGLVQGIWSRDPGSRVPRLHRTLRAGRHCLPTELRTLDRLPPRGTRLVLKNDRLPLQPGHPVRCVTPIPARSLGEEAWAILDDGARVVLSQNAFDKNAPALSFLEQLAIEGPILLAHGCIACRHC